MNQHLSCLQRVLIRVITVVSFVYACPEVALGPVRPGVLLGQAEGVVLSPVCIQH